MDISGTFWHAQKVASQNFVASDQSQPSEYLWHYLPFYMYGSYHSFSAGSFERNAWPRHDPLTAPAAGHTGPCRRPSRKR